LGVRPPKSRVSLPSRPPQPHPERYRERVFDPTHCPIFRRIILPFLGSLSVGYVFEGNSGNMGTDYVSQAESLEFGGRLSVPKRLGRFGNMGTEMSDRTGRKSARVWLPHSPASRGAALMARDWEPDPEAVGPAIMAWYALHDALAGDPAEMVAWAAEVIAARLGECRPRAANHLTPAEAVAIDDAKLLLGLVAEIFGRTSLPPGDEAALAFKAELKRDRGRPAENKFAPQSLAWWGVAREVQSLIDQGMLQKAAVGEVAMRRGLKDALVAGWCRDRRKALEESKKRRRGLVYSASAAQ
jgi:hypothetical protein